MNAVRVIENVLRSGLLTPELLIVPSRGATRSEIRVEESLLGKTLSSEHKELLCRWNGVGLEVVRFFGCGEGTNEVGRLSELQVDLGPAAPGALVVGADASGYVYAQDSGGAVHSMDTDGGTVKRLADDLDDFVGRVVFGRDAASFAGDEWLQELKAAGIVET